MKPGILQWKIGDRIVTTLNDGFNQASVDIVQGLSRDEAVTAPRFGSLPSSPPGAGIGTVQPPQRAHPRATLQRRHVPSDPPFVPPCASVANHRRHLDLREQSQGWLARRRLRRALLV
jgi:hypothetical protein